MSWKVKAIIAASSLIIMALVILPLFLFVQSPTAEPSKFIGPQVKAQNKKVDVVSVGEGLTVGTVNWKVLEANKVDMIVEPEREPSIPEGVFVLLRIQANSGESQARQVYTRQFTIIDSRKREFKRSVDGQAALAFAGKEAIFYQEAGPGKSLDGYVVFDVSQDATGLKLKIDDFDPASSNYGYIDLAI